MTKEEANKAIVKRWFEEFWGPGPWTVRYIAMRVLGWPDAFPHTDYGIKKSLSDRLPNEILALSRKWSPWRSYATISLWNFLLKQEDY